MARSGQDGQLEPGGADHLAVLQRRSPAVAVGGIRGADRGAGQLVQPCRTRRVVGVPVGDEDEFDGGRARQRPQVGFVVRSGIHHHRGGATGSGKDVGVGPVQAHRARDWAPG